MKKKLLLLIVGILSFNLNATEKIGLPLISSEKKDGFNKENSKTEEAKSLIKTDNFKRGVLATLLLGAATFACFKLKEKKDDTDINVLNKMTNFAKENGNNYEAFYKFGQKIVGATGIIVGAKYAIFGFMDPNGAWKSITELFTKNPYDSLEKESAFKKNSAIFYETMVKRFEEEKAAKEIK